MRDRLGILAVASFIAGYAAFMVVVRSPIYDRYILYLIPPLCVLAGVGLWRGIRRALPSSDARTIVMAVLVAAILVASRPGILEASGYGIGVGPRADRTNEGYRTLCSWLRAQSTGPLIVWNHALSWPFAYCLQGSRVLDYWFPTAADISPESPDMLVALSKADDPTTLSVLSARGWSVTLVQAFLGSGDQENFWVYRIQPPT